MENLNEEIHIVPIPLVHIGSISYWGIPGLYQGEKLSKIERKIKKQLNAGKNALNAFNNAYISDKKIIFIVDDRGVDGRDFYFKKEGFPFSISSERIVIPPEELKFNEYSFSEKRLYELAKRDHSIRTSSECGTIFSLIMQIFPNAILVAHLPTVCVSKISIVIQAQKRQDVFIRVTDSKGPF